MDGRVSVLEEDSFYILAMNVVQTGSAPPPNSTIQLVGLLRILSRWTAAGATLVTDLIVRSTKAKIVLNSL
jgi:hypothetical protein